MPKNRWTAAELPDMSGRTVVVTGASSGIGAVTAGELARVGAKVVLAVRDVAKGERVAASIAGDTVVRELKLDELASVRGTCCCRTSPTGSSPSRPISTRAGGST